jgi:hypothetical protein
VAVEMDSPMTRTEDRGVEMGEGVLKWRVEEVG